MQCGHVDENGRQCQMTAMVLSGDGFCYNHSPSVDTDERRASKRKGGQASKKVRPLDVPSLRQLLDDMEQGTGDDILQVKRILVRAMADLLDGNLTPTQFRALCSSGISTLKDVIALDVWRQLMERVERLEGGDEPLRLQRGDEWQVTSRSED